MEVVVKYNQYNTDIEKAIINIDEDKGYEISVVENNEDDAIVNKLQIKATNTLSSDEITLEMTLSEAKQFNLLFTQLLRQL